MAGLIGGMPIGVGFEHAYDLRESCRAIEKSANMPTPTPAVMAAPRLLASSTTERRRTVQPHTSARIWCHVALAAPPPDCVDALDGLAMLPKAPMQVARLNPPPPARPGEMVLTVVPADADERGPGGWVPVWRALPQ